MFNHAEDPGTSGDLAIRALQEEREAATAAIVESTAHVRVVVAGPGTGKTTTFSRALAKVGNRGLVMTFIRTLRDDLKSKLPRTVRVITFDGYCYGLLRSSENRARLYPNLLDIVGDDLSRIRGRSVSAQSIEWAFHDIDDGNALITDSLARMDEYGSVSFVDVIYRTLVALEARPQDTEVLPLIVVDEYQDLSLLETRFISALAKASPLLAAGDDDQSLYSFKRASPEHLRSLVNAPNAVQFTLPFCSRCTQVIVDAVNDVIAAAVRSGRLRGRLAKPFRCYLPDKLSDSQAHPRIIHARLAVHDEGNQVAAYVVSIVRSIAATDIAESRRPGEEYPTVLVLGPEPLISHAVRGLKAVYPQTEDKRSQRRKIDPIDGYRFLAEEEESKLGWRIILRAYYNREADADLTAALKPGTDFRATIPAAYRAEHETYVALVRRAIAREELSDDDWGLLEAQLRRSRDAIIEKLAPVAVEEESPDIVNDENSPESTALQPTIVCTSLVGSKGLSAGYVFLVGFIDGYVSASSGATDDDVSRFVVALSRTRKECHLVSVESYYRHEEKPSPLLGWIAAERIEQRNVADLVRVQ